ncbi:NLI-interacting factor [Strigomonas culicis]|uniref:Mitochondrial import inner membrane translocase subunit TIM50 n=1 Tax=Strigomonas culicis TaxID=28005 RepID=S9V777_9TRYP|nr:NLI-interacting factor [Strigomonas culicis]|eukprot:EPY36668.1 NLI-interacting factor [Strigomonas culicis]
MVLRPHLKEFLTEVMQLFEVVFWTAAEAEYAAAVVDAIERHVLGLPRSLYHHEEIVQYNLNHAAPRRVTSHANFYCLCERQSLQSFDRMKYLPLLGRPVHRTIIIDDSERSFPFTPRNAIKVPPFTVRVHRYTCVYPSAHTCADGTATSLLTRDLTKEGLYTITDSPLGTADLRHLWDTALLDLLPLLRAVAATPEDDITRELDHWRAPNYTDCDNFSENFPGGKNTHVGAVLPTRRATPIPPLRPHEDNAKWEPRIKEGLRKWGIPVGPPVAHVSTKKRKRKTRNKRGTSKRKR